MADRRHLDTLTERWRRRHDAARPDPAARRPADPDREDLARRAFPYLDVPPTEYVAEHGAHMVGFTYDEARYADPALDAWLLEVGRLLRERRG